MSDDIKRDDITKVLENWDYRLGRVDARRAALADGGHPDTKDLLVGDQVVVSSKLTFSRIGIIGTENL